MLCHCIRHWYCLFILLVFSRSTVFNWDPTVDLECHRAINADYHLSIKVKRIYQSVIFPQGHLTLHEHTAEAWFLSSWLMLIFEQFDLKLHYSSAYWLYKHFSSISLNLELNHFLFLSQKGAKGRISRLFKILKCLTTNKAGTYFEDLRKEEDISLPGPKQRRKSWIGNRDSITTAVFWLKINC